jgi:beta-RFAP synthase
MRDCVTVSVAARLHLGFLDLHGGLGRRFGSLGLALDEPRTTLELARSRIDEARGPQADRARAYLARSVAALGVPSGHRLIVRETIPAHAGLGSGTQMALAVAAAVRRLHGVAPDPDRDAARLDRGSRSALGTAFFSRGGIVLDGGRAADDVAIPVVARFAVPPAWRILLVLDPTREGMHGEAERAAFTTLPLFPAERAAHLCRVALMQALPALATADIEGFGRAVTEIQRVIGDHFAPVQGGRYASPGVAAALEAVARRGAVGYGQSSWGPTGFALAASAEQARDWRRSLAGLAAEKGLVVKIVQGRNEGAAIREQVAAGKEGAVLG